MESVGQARGFSMLGGQAVPAIVRAEAGQGAPAITIAGLPDATGAGLGARLAGALAPSARLDIDIRPRRGPVAHELDLAAALAALVAMEKLHQAPMARFVAAAGLLPGGVLGPIDGIEAVAIQVAARDLTLICADGQADAATRAGGGTVLSVPDVATLLRQLGGTTPLPPPRPGVGGFAEGGVIALAGSPLLGSGAPVPVFTSTGPQGHRGRMREKVLERGTDALADYEVLEMLLFLAYKMGDTKPLAKRLINAFGSFAGVLTAPAGALFPVPGVNAHVATTVQVVRAAAERLARAELAERPLLNNWDKLIAYLTTVMAREPVEQFRVLFLDTRNRLLADESLGRGTVNHTPVYPREVVKRALELHATAIILVHNHPSGDPTPSGEDVEMTLEVKNAAGTLGVVLHDHIIIGSGGWRSLRKERLL
jgi:DNA repair protein RadC